MTQAEVLEGTWEEIGPKAEAIARRKPGQSVKLIILTQEGAESEKGAGDGAHFYKTATPEEFRRAFEALADGNEHLPVLPSDAFEREAIYEDCR